jgi:nitrite reductase/ring-hydroxylating ferredoxin subunit
MGTRKGPLVLVEALERVSALDGLGKTLGRTARGALSPPTLKGLLSGTWMGHAAHPPLTDVVIGSLVSTSVLDLIGGEDSDVAAQRLILVALAAYGPTALSGVNDWADTEVADPRVRRVGLIHAAVNASAMSLYTASLAARRGGNRGQGRVLGFAGAALLSLGGYLGGHLTFARGVGANQTAFDAGPEDWIATTPAGAPPDGQAARVLAADTPVLLVRRRGALHALHDRCSHRGCSLAEGELDDDTVTCACHGSRFSLSDGSVLRGPATAAQPVFEVREQDGAVELRLRQA